MAARDGRASKLSVSSAETLFFADCPFFLFLPSVVSFPLGVTCFCLWFASLLQAAAMSLASLEEVEEVESAVVVTVLGAARSISGSIAAEAHLLPPSQSPPC